jgi:hypothetical protein
MSARMKLSKTIFIKLLVILFAFLTGCVSSLGQARVYCALPPKLNNQDIEIIYAKPTRDYILLADFECFNVSNKFIRNKAAKYGADAVFVSSYSGSFVYSEEELRSTTRSSGIKQHCFCSAIKYK